MRNLHKLFYNDYFEHKVDIEDTIDPEKTNSGRFLLVKKTQENNLTKNKKISISYDFLTTDNKKKSDDIQKKNAQILNHENGVNKLLTEASLSKKEVILNEICKPEHSLPLKTLYPGLITGVGIDHEAGIEGEFKLGIHFDYTWGQPIIYGSSVKGVLRTYFVDFAKKYFKVKPKFASFLETDLDDFIKNGFYDIFEGKENEKYKSIYERDTFFDAVIIVQNERNKILDCDTLCPHGDNPLKNPTPISFLKIASGVTIEFRFKLVKSIIGDKEITEKDKIAIFKDILTTVGIGAKTNVGYGQFSEINPEK